MPNTFYPDLDNDYPNKLDDYEPVTDVTDATYALAQKYQSYINQGSNTYGGPYTGFQLAAQLKADHPELQKMDITADKLNRLQQMIISTQRFARSLKLQTILSLTKPAGSIKQVVGSIWGKIVNPSTAAADGLYKVDLHVLEDEKGTYVPYYPKTSADQVVYTRTDGTTVDGETKLKEEIQKLKDVYNITTYDDISQLNCTSYVLSDIIKKMPDHSLFITGYSPSDNYVRQNTLPSDSGIIKINRTALNRTALEITAIADNGSRYVHYHSVYVAQNNTLTAWKQISYNGHIHDDRYYTEGEIDQKINAVNASVNQAMQNHNAGGDHDWRYYTQSIVDNKLAGIINNKYDKTGGIIHGDVYISNRLGLINSNNVSPAYFYLHDNAFKLGVYDPSDPDADSNNHNLVFYYTLDGKLFRFNKPVNASQGISGRLYNINSTANHEGVYITQKDNFIPTTDGVQSSGTSTSRWANIYSKNGSISTSDRNEKRNIGPLSDKYRELFMKLKPVSYGFKTGDRTHIGYISQDVENAMAEAGLTSKDFAGFCKDTNYPKKKNPYYGIEAEKLNALRSENPELEINTTSKYLDEEDTSKPPITSYGLRYSEFIALNTYMIQRLMKEVDDLKAKLAEKEAANGK